MSNFKNLVDLAESYASDFRDDRFQHQIVAICVKSGKPIALGVKKFKYGKNKSTFECSTHAEIDLLSKLGDKAKGSKIYVYRFNNNAHPEAREVKNAKPCLLCQHVLKLAGVARISYIDNDGNVMVLKNRDLVTLIANPINITHHFLHRSGVDHDNKFSPTDYVKKVG